MELIYLFLKDENKFKNQNLNFGSEYIFNYLLESNTLEVFKNELYIKDHYKVNNSSFANLSNITSIIGQNGTGKTTILNFLIENFISGVNLNKEVVFAVKVNEEIIIYYTESFPIINNLETFRFKIEKLNLRKEKLTGKGVQGDQYVNFGYEFRGFDDTDIIYFSNVFDNSGGMELSGLYNISTNYLINGDFENNLKNRVIPNDKNNAKYHAVYNYFTNEFDRQISFIHKFYNSKLIPFELPKELTISIKNNYLNIGVDEKIFQKDSNTYVLLFELFQVLNKIEFNYLTDLEKQKIRIVVNIYLSFIIDFLLSYQSAGEYFETKLLFENSKMIFSYEDIIKSIERFNSYQKKHISNDDLKNKLDNLISLLNIIWDVNNDNEQFYIDHGDIKLNIESKNYEAFNEFYELYKNIFIIRPFFDLRWRNISSGEKALLNIFSRFHSLTNNELFGKELKGNLIILIDEGDLYLHPEWQKRFVKILIDFLPVIFESKSNGFKRTLQIIFTTNSPIPASDLLSYNTIFLENFNDENGKSQTIVKDSLNEQKETFAANIHTLLSDSFFVKGGLIGDFASDKLNKIIDKLIKRVDLSKEERENMRKLIHQVGEPVLKIKLMQMYNDRYNLDIHERLDIIEKELGI